jgi:hypothetical protein
LALGVNGNKSAGGQKIPFLLQQLSPSPNLTQVALTSATREIFLLDLIEADLFEDILGGGALGSGTSSGLDGRQNNGGGQLNLASLADFTSPFLKPLIQGLHSGPVDMLDVAQEVPLFVTASKIDRSVRVWNYLERECEIVKTFLDSDGGDDASSTSPECIARILQERKF